ncbi:MAG: hypothetical protein IPJ84_01870 [Bdellovibrionales bacterium]|nr:hypothetical protein [Bdellovibrionales bacterium]
MELNPVQPFKKYKEPVFVKSQTYAVRRATAAGRVFHETAPDAPVFLRPDDVTEASSEVETSIGKMGLEEFVERFESLRNELAERRLRKLRLSSDEVVILRILNKCIDELVGYSKPQDHLDALEIAREAKRLSFFRNK